MSDWLSAIPKTKVMLELSICLNLIYTLSGIIILVRCYSVLCEVPLPSEFWREVLPRTLKACFGPRFLSAPSSAPGDWAFGFAAGALEGLRNTLSFRLAFRL